MRRRLVLAAFLLDGLCALAAPLVLPALDRNPDDEVRYVEVAGACLETVDVAGMPSGGLAGRPVEAALCR